MELRGRRRRNWLTFGLVLVGIPVFAYVAFGVLMAMTGLFLDAPPR